MSNTRYIFHKTSDLPLLSRHVQIKLIKEQDLPISISSVTLPITRLLFGLPQTASTKESILLYHQNMYTATLSLVENQSHDLQYEQPFDVPGTSNVLIALIRWRIVATIILSNQTAFWNVNGIPKWKRDILNLYRHSVTRTLNSETGTLFPGPKLRFSWQSTDQILCSLNSKGKFEPTFLSASSSHKSYNWGIGAETPAWSMGRESPCQGELLRPSPPSWSW